MVCDLTPRPGELWQSVTNAHAWRVRVLGVSLNSVKFMPTAGPGSHRKREHWMSLSAFQICYRKVGH